MSRASVSPAAPNTSHPSSAHRLKNRCMTPALRTSTLSTAPEDAFEVAGLNGALFLAHTTTPSTFKKCAVRMIAPRFCGSTTSSSASHTGGDPTPSQVGSASMGMGASGDASIATPLCGFTPPTVVLPPTPRTAVSMFKSCLETISISNRNSSVTRVRNRASRRNKSHPSCAKTLCTARRSASNAARTGFAPYTASPINDSASVNTPVSSRARFFASWRSCHTVRSRGSSKASNASRRPRPPREAPREAFAPRPPRFEDASRRVDGPSSRPPARLRRAAKPLSRASTRPNSESSSSSYRSTYPSSSSKRPRAPRASRGREGGGGSSAGAPPPPPMRQFANAATRRMACGFALAGATRARPSRLRSEGRRTVTRDARIARLESIVRGRGRL